MENILKVCINRASADKGNVSRHIIESSMAAFYVGYCIPFSKFIVTDSRPFFIPESRGGQGSGPPPHLKNHKNIGFSSITGQDPLKIHCWAIIGKPAKRHFHGVSLIAFRYMPMIPGRVAQSVTCLATDASLTADQGVASSIPARSHTFVEIDHAIISTVILLPSAESFKKGCCQLQAKVCARSTG